MGMKVSDRNNPPHCFSLKDTYTMVIFDTLAPVIKNEDGMVYRSQYNVVNIMINFTKR